MEDTLLINCKQKFLCRGTIFRFKGKYPFTEPSVDFMICQVLGSSESSLALYCVTGYYAGCIEYVFPVEAMAENAIAINTKWLIENWNKYVYDGFDVSEVKVIL